METCSTCNNRPLWGCDIFGCDEVNGCFIMCPECGKLGFGMTPDNFIGDMELAAILTERREKWRTAA